ncbi:hypothetical protein HXX76_002121 [Chlamydomonas incerta]|uniref:Uncharacterized protein n=1 Tax=Chlamydomonas incerta TaxID=51695 RepID=A0A835WAG8_CHLIN|nr:hypothetical protein HXX76_002121 [Chlamydomonas incerta]|eukprot:KAG2443777.1 hypothetical protein HXX76_002121 [Chlamydomonas incerta]
MILRLEPGAAPQVGAPAAATPAPTPATPVPGGTAAPDVGAAAAATVAAPQAAAAVTVAAQPVAAQPQRAKRPRHGAGRVADLDAIVKDLAKENKERAAKQDGLIGNVVVAVHAIVSIAQQQLAVQRADLQLRAAQAGPQQPADPAVGQQ